MDGLGDRIWDLVDRSTRNARRHNVAALLYRLKPAEVTEQDQDAFASTFRQTLAQNLLFLEATRQMLEAFRRAKIPMIPLKGVLFASRFYESIGVRPQSDVDILVCEQDLDGAHRLLLERGFHEAWPRAYYEDHYHWVYQRGSVLLELHWALKSPGTCTPSLSRIWDLARRVSAEEMEFLEMSPEDLLAYMAVNKGHQHFPALLDFVDLAMILYRFPIQWECFCRQVLDDKTAGPVWFGLTVSRELLDAPAPVEVLQDLSKPFYARLAVLLKRLLDFRGGPLHVSPKRLDGPTGRLYEIFLEGHPSAIFHLLRPLIIPSKARVDILAEGSYPRYYFNQLRRLFWQIARS